MLLILHTWFPFDVADAGVTLFFADLLHWAADCYPACMFVLYYDVLGGQVPVLQRVPDAATVSSTFPFTSLLMACLGCVHDMPL